MSLILNIDTSSETASVSLAENSSLLQEISNTVPKDHAAFLHNAIKQLFKSSSLNLHQVDAIAVTKGPGSYTGLRVGMASAKGLCYALNKPLITVGTLNVMAKAIISSLNKLNETSSLYCPLIDARRMEVFTALFDGEMNEISPPSALILHKSSFDELLETNTVYFFGSGAKKLADMLEHKNAVFPVLENLTASLGLLSHESFLLKNFADIISSEPLYVKEFYSSPDPKNKLMGSDNNK